MPPPYGRHHVRVPVTVHIVVVGGQRLRLLIVEILAGVIRDTVVMPPGYHDSASIVRRRMGLIMKDTQASCMGCDPGCERWQVSAVLIILAKERMKLLTRC